MALLQKKNTAERALESYFEDLLTCADVTDADNLEDKSDPSLSDLRQLFEMPEIKPADSGMQSKNNAVLLPDTLFSPTTFATPLFPSSFFNLIDPAVIPEVAPQEKSPGDSFLPDALQLTEPLAEETFIDKKSENPLPLTPIETESIGVTGEEVTHSVPEQDSADGNEENEKSYLNNPVSHVADNQRTANQRSTNKQSLANEQRFDDYHASTWLENGRPSWAEQDFDLLLCRVNGFSLAVPLITLGQIYEITDELTPIIGQAEWFMGFQPIPGGKVRVVNTALYVMPERYDRDKVQFPNYVLTLNGIPWGLGLNSVDQPIRIKPGAVKWRKDRSSQPWMAGVVKDHMCVLLDIPTLGRRLLDSDKKLRKD